MSDALLFQGRVSKDGKTLVKHVEGEIGTGDDHFTCPPSSNLEKGRCTLTLTDGRAWAIDVYRIVTTEGAGTEAHFNRMT